MKTTESGWADYVMDKFMSLAEMRDRIAATSMLATWRWTRNPTSFAEANKAILQAMTKELATTYIEGVQDSMYRMGLRARGRARNLGSGHGDADRGGNTS
jgi:urate oxidase